ncbi:hypothetical protein PMAYCL1PPCAC_23989 [Pristionchus mayeri]|uniref:peptidylprolyl isomerase n=1 Tax=Pristionchus mayeri TaxID=1317129 RepID=A0AAN5CZY8_9BILA|nr:hypothetical protein PMAYCL1PPCAC_23989 [Pristionchus mayeri]
MDEMVAEESECSLSSDGLDDVGIHSHGFMEGHNFIQALAGRRAISSGEPSLDGSIDDERSALSDTEIGNAMRTETIAKQARGPSSDALEGDCMAEHLERSERNQCEWEDVLGSGELMRKVERNGDGQRPTDECSVRINVVDNMNGFDSDENLEFVLGFSCVIDAWELVVKMMRVGEKCRVKCSPRFAYGEKGLHPNITCNQYQDYTIELISSVKMDLSSLAVDELFAFLIKLKDRGNFFFSREEYEKAIFVYKRAISKWNECEDEEDAGMKKVLSALHSNLAVSYSKVEEWKNCLESAESSLAVDKLNGKALFRKGQSLSRLGEAEEAMKYLKEARLIDPNNSAIEIEFELAKRCADASRVKEKKMYQKMLSGISEKELKSEEENMKKENILHIMMISSLGAVVIGVLLYLMLE